MATTKSKRTTIESSAQISKEETVLVPVLAQPYAKAPATDPYLRAGTVTAENLTVCGYTLPPILRGIQPGLGLQGKPHDYSVKVVWMSRHQIQGMLAAMGEAHPELEQALGVVSSYLCHMDSMRDEVKLGTLAARGWIKEEHPGHQHAIENLDTVARMLGRWRDEVRLHLR